MRQVYRAREKAFVDYAGAKLTVVERSSGNSGTFFFGRRNAASALEIRIKSAIFIMGPTIPHETVAAHWVTGVATNQLQPDHLRPLFP